MSKLPFEIFIVHRPLKQNQVTTIFTFPLWSRHELESKVDYVWHWRLMWNVKEKSLHLFLKFKPRVGLNSMSVRCERFLYVLVEGPCTFEVTKVGLEVRSEVTMSHVLITPCLEVLTQLSSLLKHSKQKFHSLLQSLQLIIRWSYNSCKSRLIYSIDHNIYTW